MRILTAIVTTFIATTIANPVFAGTDVTLLPGYVNFDTNALLADTDATVEINLSEPMLKFMAGVMSVADQELAGMLRGIVDMRIKVYELDPADAERVQPEIDGLVDWFEENQWSRIIHVKEESESVNIYSRLDGDNMLGLALVVASESELVFINIVGEIDPAKMGTLIGRMSGDAELDLGFLSSLGASASDSEATSNH